MSDAERGLAERLERLEQQVLRISEHLGLTDDDTTDEIPPEVVELALAGRQLEAVRRYAQLTGADLTTATSIVNAIV
jgi:hypothetical protein